MKDAIHHLKHVQKKVLQSIRREAAAKEAQLELNSKKQEKQEMATASRGK